MNRILVNIFGSCHALPYSYTDVYDILSLDKSNIFYPDNLEDVIFQITQNNIINLNITMAM
jgi:hypothetical protein